MFCGEADSHYELALIQAEVARLGPAAFTKTALDGGKDMGLRRNFHKSMTTYADHRIWQDVYYASTPADKEAYIKITMRAAAPVIQFKER